ncbi:hypothetical protein OUZ56_008472 [Daphnia magna]|uniref:Uncharacterized protein n=1 Tax=Daphnia magna TaxID=35525 RepID=A0ABR0ADH4_9CRUS|nr:hypothetical protein OUZ56_008472 [Daphnia magna]
MDLDEMVLTGVINVKLNLDKEKLSCVQRWKILICNLHQNQSNTEHHSYYDFLLWKESFEQGLHRSRKKNLSYIYLLT